MSEHAPTPPKYDPGKWDAVAIARMTAIWWDDYAINKAPCYCECVENRKRDKR